MKKLILLIILLAITVSIQAQTTHELITSVVAENVAGYVEEYPEEGVGVIQGHTNYSQFNIFAGVTTAVNMYSDLEYSLFWQKIDEPNTYVSVIRMDMEPGFRSFLLAYNTISNKIIIFERDISED